MLITTTNQLHLPSEVCHPGIVHAFDLRSLNVISGAMANLASFFGSSGAPGEIDKVYEESKKAALSKLEASAKEMGADAIIGLRMQLVDLGISGGRDSMLGCNVSGTAVRFLNAAATRTAATTRPATSTPTTNAATASASTSASASSAAGHADAAQRSSGMPKTVRGPSVDAPPASAMDVAQPSVSMSSTTLKRRRKGNGARKRHNGAAAAAGGRNLIRTRRNRSRRSSS